MRSILFSGLTALTLVAAAVPAMAGGYSNQGDYSNYGRNSSSRYDNDYRWGRGKHGCYYHNSGYGYDNDSRFGSDYRWGGGKHHKCYYGGRHGGYGSSERS